MLDAITSPSTEFVNEALAVLLTSVLVAALVKGVEVTLAAEDSLKTSTFRALVPIVPEVVGVGEVREVKDVVSEVYEEEAVDSELTATVTVKVAVDVVVTVDVKVLD